MKSLVIATGVMLVLLGSWFGFSVYSEDVLEACIDDINNNVIYNVEKEDWEASERSFADVESKWEEYRTVAHFFMPTEDLNDIDYTFARIEKFIATEDSSGAGSELSYLADQFYFLYHDEKLTLANIL